MSGSDWFRNSLLERRDRRGQVVARSGGDDRLARSFGGSCFGTESTSRGEGGSTLRKGIVAHSDPGTRGELSMLTRRSLIGGLCAVAATRAASQTVGLSFGTYALWMLRWEDSLELISRTGYDGVELAVMPDWPTAPKSLSRTDRARLRGLLGDLGLALPAILEDLKVMHPTQSHRENLDRLRRAIELGSEISPGRPPIFETVLGRRPDEWDEVKNGMVDEIGEWTRAAAAGETVICFKPHVAHAVNNIERSLWLLDQVDSPFFRCTYDYSHLWLAGHELVPSLEALLPVSPYIHLKDARGQAGTHQFLLPGDGETDYAAMFRAVRDLEYQGYANVEVSAQIHKKDDFEPIPATRICYERMAAAFEQAGLTRP